MHFHRCVSVVAAILNGQFSMLVLTFSRAPTPVLNPQTSKPIRPITLLRTVSNPFTALHLHSYARVLATENPRLDHCHGC